jgi:naringenin degradation protein FdeH
MAKPVRRIVTGHNAEGKSVFVMDGDSPFAFTPAKGGVTVTELWETRVAPASNAGSDEVMDHKFGILPPKNGSVFRIIEYPPDKGRFAEYDREAAFRAMGAPDALDRAAPRHPGFHKTDTIDYVIVLEGEICALMDEGEVLMKQGDVLIQRGTNHAWSNRTDKPCYVMFVLVDAKPAP